MGLLVRFCIESMRVSNYVIKEETRDVIEKLSS